MSDDMEANFGRGEDMPGGNRGGDMGGQIPGGDVPADVPEGNGGGGRGFMDIPGMEQTVAYVTDISATVDLTVLSQLLGICILLAMVSGAASVITIMRYEPLKILSNRD